MKISQIIDKINEKHLFVPAFQREYVWKKPDAKNLVSSLINDYPTGTMLNGKSGIKDRWNSINIYLEIMALKFLILDTLFTVMELDKGKGLMRN